MTDDPKHPPPDDQAPDPAEAELVAYLDGELDPTTARTVEAKLAADPALRARAAALKRTFDLLDYLPRPDPSPTFATRTLDRLPALSGSASGTQAPPAPAAHLPSSPSSSAPVVLSGGQVPAAQSGRPWAWALGLLLAAGLAVAAGYLGTAAARAYFQPPPKDLPAVSNLTPPAESDAQLTRVIEFLPLYAAADDLEFVRALAADPDLFADEADGPGGIPTPSKLAWAAHLPTLAATFKALPPDRQAQIRKLDGQLHQLDPAERLFLVRALEAYAVWLDRLPDADRKEVLSAANGKDRLEQIREVRRRQWVDTLPAAQQKQLKGLPNVERAALMSKWRTEEAARRRAWELPAATREAVRRGEVIWPFNNEELKKQVIEYARAVYRFDDKTVRPRFVLPEQPLLLDAYELGEEKNAWLSFGRLLHELAGRYEMLPEPRDGKPVTEFAQLPDPVKTHYVNRPKPSQRLERFAGRWPDFALAIHEDLTASKVGPLLAGVALGPARPDDFREPTKAFVIRDLMPILAGYERRALGGLEGRWPEYPRLLVQLAWAHDLSIPGVMLPGRPSEWEKTYGGGVGPPQFRPRG
jgi:hypothetical protein